MRGRSQGYFIGVFCLFLLSVFLTGAHASSTQDYLDELHLQGKERVIVIFHDEVDPAFVTKYSGTLIRTFLTIKGLVCELPQENIELLRQEEAVKDVVPDMLIEIQESYAVRDPEELAEELRLKEEYLNSIRLAYYAAIKEAREELIRFYQEDLARRRQVLLLYQKILTYLRESGYIDTYIYRYFLARYNTLLEQYYSAWQAAIREYFQKITQARNVYVEAASGWREPVREMMAESYDGTVEVRWNNLEAGLNSKAAWDDRFNLDGTGVKIAFLDTGINYTLENLDDNYLGGYDFVDGDDDPMPTLDQTEDHGTAVASLAVGEGMNKVVGVAYNATYYSVRISANDAEGGLVSDVISGIEWASAEPHKADIINMSLATYGGGVSWPMLKAELENACNTAYNNAVILVAGSGNEGYTYSGWPAAFDNVISVGAHAEDQTFYNYNGRSTNGGVDVIAPGARVYSVGADNSSWWYWGTSCATSHASALIALEIQYARQRGLEVNNGYLWEVMKHGAKDLGHDTVFQGNGKIWAAESNDPPPDPHAGSIDLMGASIWPFDFTFDYYDYLYLLDGLYPAYFLGTTMSQDITIENISDEPDIPDTYVENLNVTTIQKYRDTLNILPGDSTEDFETYEPIALNPGDIVTLPDDYYLPLSASPGLYNVVLDLEFNLVGNPRLLKITLNEASIWCPPGPPPSTQTGYGQSGYGRF